MARESKTERDAAEQDADFEAKVAALLKVDPTGIIGKGAKSAPADGSEAVE